MKKRILIAILLAAMVLLSVYNSNVLAHNSSQNGVIEKSPTAGTHAYYGSEEIGWIINEEGHTNGSTLQYKFQSGLSEEVKGLVMNGAQKWTNTHETVTISINPSAIGTVKTKSLSENVFAQTVKSGADANGHLTSWRIEINTKHLILDPSDPPDEVVTASTIAHEFGHVIGLRDLYQSYNINKIMYGYQTPNQASVPHTQDIRGARLILGWQRTCNRRFIRQSVDQPASYRQ